MRGDSHLPSLKVIGSLHPFAIKKIYIYVYGKRKQTSQRVTWCVDVISNYHRAHRRHNNTYTWTGKIIYIYLIESLHLSNRVLLNTCKMNISRLIYSIIVIFQTDVTWRDLTVHKLMQEYSLEFQSNFDRQIFLVIHEAELMEQLGNITIFLFLIHLVWMCIIRRTKQKETWTSFYLLYL